MHRYLFFNASTYLSHNPPWSGHPWTNKISSFSPFGSVHSVISTYISVSFLYLHPLIIHFNILNGKEIQKYIHPNGAIINHKGMTTFRKTNQQDLHFGGYFG